MRWAIFFAMVFALVVGCTQPTNSSDPVKDAERERDKAIADRETLARELNTIKNELRDLRKANVDMQRAIAILQAKVGRGRGPQTRQAARRPSTTEQARRGRISRRRLILLSCSTRRAIPQLHHVRMGIA